MMLYLELFLRFLYTGLFAVGGGLATLPFLTEMSQATGWFSASDLSDMIAVSESTPGPLGVNMATYVGFQTGGVPGALLAVLGLITPSVVIVLLIARILQKFRSSKLIDHAFYGLRAASMGLIAAACFGVAKIAFFSRDVFEQSGNLWQAVNYKSILLFIAVFVLLRLFKKLHPIWLILLAAAAGIVLQMS